MGCAIFADVPIARAPRPYPPGLARWSASPSPVVRGVPPRGFAAAADAAEDREPSDLDPPPRPPRLVDIRRRALRRDSKLTLDALRVAVVASAHILEPSDVAAFCFQLRDRARLERHRWGAHADDDAALRALARALARVVHEIQPEDDPRAFVRLHHGVASLASAAKGGHGVHPRASLVRGGDGDGDGGSEKTEGAAVEVRTLAARAREFTSAISAKDLATVLWSTSRLAAAAEETVTDADVRKIAAAAAKAAVGFDEKDMRRARDALVGLGDRVPRRWRMMIEAVADARADGRLLAPAKTKSATRRMDKTTKKEKTKKREDGDENDGGQGTDEDQDQDEDQDEDEDGSGSGSGSGSSG